MIMGLRLSLPLKTHCLVTAASNAGEPLLELFQNSCIDFWRCQIVGVENLHSSIHLSCVIEGGRNDA